MPIPRIAIVGGGFAGTLALANIVEDATSPLAIELFEDKEVGTGVAYGTTDISHLLNVRAERMGAFAGKPEGFFQWLQTDKGKAEMQRLWAGHTIDGNSYVPRQLYGSYLVHIHQQTLETARKKGIEVNIRQRRVIDATLHDAETQQLILSFSKGGVVNELLVDALVLATGNLPPRRFTFQTGLIRGTEHYVADVWQPSVDNIFPDKVGQLSADSEIVIIGTGLTMLDTVLTLKKRGFKGTITALSRHGLLPAVHADAKPYPQWQWSQQPSEVPTKVFDMFLRLRAEIEKAASEGYDWRSVIDSLRPVTQKLWQRLDMREKRKFMNRLGTLWNVHRHRMAPEIHAEIKTLQQNGTLKILAGKIHYVGSDEHGLTVAYRKRGANRIETIRAAMVLNCTGPEYDIGASTHRLLKNLRDRELITVGPLRIGIEVTRHGTARGKASDVIYPLGSLLVGELLECTAVPELREQAHNVSKALLKHLHELRDKDRKAHLLAGAWI